MPLHRFATLAVATAVAAGPAPVAAQLPAAAKPENPEAQTNAPRSSAAEAEETAVPQGLEEEGPKLDFYGFGDANYMNLLAGKDTTWAQFVAPKPSFYVGHLNLYMAASLARRWRSLAEVRFTYAPQFDENAPTSGNAFTPTDTTASDYADVNGNIQWSGIEIQRAWIEYQPLDYLTVRFGQWLTPYGYWNDDHGSPTILAMIRPFPINGQLFPERQTGLEAYGKLFWGDWAFAYTFTLSNGRGPYSAIRDLDANKALGGRIEVENSVHGDLSFGVAAYRGKYTASTQRVRLDTSSGTSKTDLYRTKDVAYQELSLGADLRWSWQHLLLQGEIMVNDAAYDDNGRPPVNTCSSATRCRGSS
jgi:hypothetical protein